MIVPGLTLCADCRVEDAMVVSAPGERWARALCADCADREIEHACMPVEMVRALKAAREEWRYRPAPPLRADWRSADWSKLDRLHRQWLAFQAEVKDEERCWAMLADGSRCVRVAADAGVCVTHAAVGCRLPGLGWKGGEPQGRIIQRQGRRSAIPA